MRIGIIDAGMAGLSCAQALRHQDHNAIVFDKSRGPDGRVSTRCIDTPLGDAAFDQGAQELTARAPSENFAGGRRRMEQVVRRRSSSTARRQDASADRWNESADCDDR
jgi:predicted NAD/FAD-dependent oxidoreductase